VSVARAPHRTGLAHEQAARAAERSQVAIRTVRDLERLAQVVGLLDEVWANPGPPVVGVEHLRALAYTGGYVGVAYDGDVMVAASLAFFAAPPGRVLHSDVTGVRSRARGRQVGFALKLHQRAWALDLGLAEITWTFDPLLSRNAHFNLSRLRARATAYEEDFYGDMPDGVNAGQGSDRLLASWSIGSREVAEACDRALPVRSVRPRPPAVLSDVDGRPVRHQVDGARQVRVEIPGDIEALRRTDADLGRAWRHQVRRTLGAELAAGARVVAFERDTGYVVDRGGGHADPVG
jgi:predicted GNAT superfamily acetyltransferase